MAQLDPMHRYGDNPRSASLTPSIEQFHLVGEAQTWSSRSFASSSARSLEVHDPEDMHYHSRKLTVIARVKEKARRWRNSFLKRKNSEGDNTTPSWGVRLEDDEDYEDEDPEYLGAPMYESELAPQGYKEHARQNPRAVPVISEKHVLASSVKTLSEQSKKGLTLAETLAMKPVPPANPSGIDATQKTASKIQGLFVSAPTASETEKHATRETNNNNNNNNRAAKKTGDSGIHEAEDKYASRESDKHELKTDTPLSPKENKWDKGVSVKEYIMNKLEPGEDEKALSQVISNAISPRKIAGDGGVIEKVKVAVNSLLWREEPPQSTAEQSDNANSSSHIPISTNAQAVMEEDNKGRILQTN